MKNIYFSVTNDLVSDQRVHRIISSLMKYGLNPCLIGRRRKDSLSLDVRNYKMIRFRMFFNKGFLFYAFFNLRLLLFLITRKKINILVANDLDTLPACYLVSLFRRTVLVYDSHEYFTETPELINRRFVRNFWLWIEKRIVPRLKYAYTVSQPIADEYFEKYAVRFQVVRNLPVRIINVPNFTLPVQTGKKKILIYQGSLNIGRGLEIIIETMKDIQEVIFLIAGDGDIRIKLENYVKNNNLGHKIYFLGKVPFKDLRPITVQADGGVSFEEDAGLNYRYSLPNKLFDYINALVPVFVSDLPEIRSVVEKYNIGVVCNSREIGEIKKSITELLFNDEKRMIWKKNLISAAKDLSWENEEKHLYEVYSGLI